MPENRRINNLSRAASFSEASSKGEEREDNKGFIIKSRTSKPERLTKQINNVPNIYNDGVSELQSLRMKQIDTAQRLKETLRRNVDLMTELQKARSVIRSLEKRITHLEDSQGSHDDEKEVLKVCSYCPKQQEEIQKLRLHIIELKDSFQRRWEDTQMELSQARQSLVDVSNRLVECLNNQNTSIVKIQGNNTQHLPNAGNSNYDDSQLNSTRDTHLISAGGNPINPPGYGSFPSSNNPNNYYEPPKQHNNLMYTAQVNNSISANESLNNLESLSGTQPLMFPFPGSDTTSGKYATYARSHQQSMVDLKDLLSRNDENNNNNNNNIYYPSSNICGFENGDIEFEPKSFQNNKGRDTRQIVGFESNIHRNEIMRSKFDYKYGNSSISTDNMMNNNEFNNASNLRVKSDLRIPRSPSIKTNSLPTSGNRSPMGSVQPPSLLYSNIINNRPQSENNAKYTIGRVNNLENIPLSHSPKAYQNYSLSVHQNQPYHLQSQKIQSYPTSSYNTPSLDSFTIIPNQANMINQKSYPLGFMSENSHSYNLMNSASVNSNFATSVLHSSPALFPRYYPENRNSISIPGSEDGYTSKPPLTGISSTSSMVNWMNTGNTANIIHSSNCELKLSSLNSPNQTNVTPDVTNYNELCEPSASYNLETPEYKTSSAVSPVSTEQIGVVDIEHDTYGNIRKTLEELKKTQDQRVKQLKDDREKLLRAVLNDLQDMKDFQNNLSTIQNQQDKSQQNPPKKLYPVNQLDN
ncbi:hypothetical protein ACR3K2_00220 [Cryptosporidium serpentis]